MEDSVRLIERTDAVLKDLENAEVQRLNDALDASYLELEKELLRKYPNYSAAAQPNLLATQRGVLLSNDLTNVLSLINPSREAEIMARFERLLGTASQEGITLSDKLIELQQGESFVKATATVPIEAVAFAARDAVKRLKKHDDKFREEATAIISQGLIQGWGAMKTASQLRQRLGITKGRAETIARTEIISAQDSATRLNYKNNNIGYYTRIATQDSRVCPYCAARAGQVYPVDVPVVIHPNDRCYAAPFFPEREQSDSEETEWTKRHAEESKARAGEANEGRSPFEIAAGINAAKPVWTPKDGYLDKNVERAGQSWAVGALALAVLLGRPRAKSPAQPEQPEQPEQPDQQPEQDDNFLFKALLVGAAVAGVSVGAYYLARHRYRSGFAESARMAERMSLDLATVNPGDNDQITFVAGGFAGKQGMSGLEYAPLFGRFLGGHQMVGVETPEFDVGPGIEADPTRSVAENWANVVKTAVINGRNMSAVRMAAMAAAHYRKYGKPVNLLGYSGGGMVAAEAHEILKQMGIPTRSAGVATPWFGFTQLSPDEHITLIGKNDIFAGWPSQNRLEIANIDSHWLNAYLDNETFRTELGKWFGTSQQKQQRPKRQPVSDTEVIDATVVDLYPEVALLSEAEIKQLPGQLQQKLLAARQQASITLAPPSEIQLADARTQLANLVRSIELGTLDWGTAVIERLALLAPDELKQLPEQLRQKIAGVNLKGLLPAKPEIVLAAKADLVKVEKDIELGPVYLGQAVLESLSLLGEDELSVLPARTQQAIAGYKQQQLAGRLDPRQLPAVAASAEASRIEALYQKLAAETGTANTLKAVLRGELPLLPEFKTPLLLPAAAEEKQFATRTAQQLYQQSRSLERTIARSTTFRLRQKFAEIAQSDLPMLPKLAAYRQAVLNAIGGTVDPIREIVVPGAKDPELLQRFVLGGIVWQTGELKPTSRSLDLIRKIIDLDLPEEVLKAIDTIYLTRQKSAAEQYWKKKLKLLGPEVAATANLESNSITAYRGKGDLQEVMRQAGYLVAYRKFGALTAPKGSEYRRAMAEGRTITPYGFSSDAADFADSFAQFWLDPKRLKRFNPQRYNALARLLNYRHPVEPVSILPGAVDTRSPEIIAGLRSRNREISQSIQQTREVITATAERQRTKKVVQAIERVDDAKVSANTENLLSRSRVQEEALDRLERNVTDLEQAAAQVLNPFNPPYFAETPKQIRQAARQAKAIEKELQALDKSAAVVSKVRANINELETTLSDLTTRPESLKLSSQSRKLEDAYSQLTVDLEQAQQELAALPQSEARSQALRDLARLGAAIRAQENSVGLSVADLHRQAISPRITQLRNLADSLEQVQARLATQSNRAADLQTRLARLPQKLTDLGDDARARYSVIRSARVAQSKLPQRVENYRSLRAAYTGELAKRATDSQQLADDYTTGRQAAVANVQAALENRLQKVNDNLTVLAALQPGSVAWLVDSRNWEATEMPPDLAIVLAGQPGNTKAEKLKAAAAEVTRLIGEAKGSINVLQKRLDYVDSLAQTTLLKAQEKARHWEQIRDDLSDEETISDRQIQAFLKGEKQPKAIDITRYGNQLISELEEFNRSFVQLLLDQEGVDPRTIIDQSELYKRARDSFAAETQDTRAQIAAEIEQSLAVLNGLQQKLSRDAAQPVIYEINGKTRTAAEVRAELNQLQSQVDELLNLKQVQATVQESGYVDPERAQQRQRELDLATQQQAQVDKLKAELAEVNREIQKRREAAERGQKRGIATDRLEATQRRILKDLSKLGDISGDDGQNP